MDYQNPLAQYIVSPQQQREVNQQTAQQGQQQALIDALRAPQAAGMGPMPQAGNVTPANASMGNIGMQLGTQIGNGLNKLNTPTPTPDYGSYPTGGGLGF